MYIHIIIHKLVIAISYREHAQNKPSFLSSIAYFIYRAKFLSNIVFPQYVYWIFKNEFKVCRFRSLVYRRPTNHTYTESADLLR